MPLDPLDYDSPRPPQRTETGHIRSAIRWGAFSGCLATLPALVLALLSMVTRGEPVVARILFPLPMLLLKRCPWPTVWTFAAILAIAQFPIYSAIASYSETLGRSAFLATSAILLTFHAATVTACFIIVR